MYTERTLMALVRWQQNDDRHVVTAGPMSHRTGLSSHCRIFWKRQILRWASTLRQDNDQ